MRAFYLAYCELPAIVPQPVGQTDQGQVPPPVADLPWGHNVLLIEKLKDPAECRWYARMALEHGWSRAILDHQIDSGLYRHQGKAVTRADCADSVGTVPLPSAPPLVREKIPFRCPESPGIPDIHARTALCPT
jgi:DUF1016 N-terminal domain